MASPIEEKFIFDEIKNLRSSKIFEFGCGENLFPNKIAEIGHDVTAIDLYPRRHETNQNIKFLQDDFMNITIPPDSFDCIYALSSFEHIGLESHDIHPIPYVLSKIEVVIEKIKSILKSDGIFLVTLPFGNYRYYYSGNDKWSYNKTSESVFGAKVYDIEDIENIFKKHFEIIKEEYYIKDTGKDFFNIKSWKKMPYKDCYVKKEISHALVCLKMRRDKNDKISEINKLSKEESITKQNNMTTSINNDETITYCMMGFNSLHEIKPYIESVIPYIDRFIYIDGESIDGTIDYLLSINNKNQNDKIEIYNHPWKDNFPEQRNNYLKHFTEKQSQGYILVSDTDEHFTIDTLQNLRSIIKTTKSEGCNGIKFLAYDIIIDDNNTNKIIEEHVSKSNFHKPLMFKYHPSIKYNGSAHENIEGSFRWKPVDFTYQHIRSHKKIMERAIQNFWIYVMIQKLDEWKDLRHLCLSNKITKFKDFFDLYINSKLPIDIVRWLQDHRNYKKESNNLDLLELRDTANYYFNLPNKTTNKTISTYITTKNSLFFQATLEQTVRQALLFSDEVVISLSKLSTDGTLDLLNKLKSEYPYKVKIYIDEEYYLKHLGHDQDVLKKRKEYSLKKCINDYCILQDDDECIHEKYATLIKELPTQYPEALAFRFNVIHFYRSYDHYQNKEGWYPKKIYMVKNIPEIHHGRVDTDPDNHVIIRDNETVPLDSLSNRFIIDVPITVYHYGWCRNDNVLLMKKYLQEVRWWGKEYWNSPTHEFPFKLDNPQTLPEFKDTHPKYMLPIIEKQKQLNSMFIKDFETDFDKSFDRIIESKNKIKISACILTRNEPTRIKGTILHVYPYVDEIIINDGSDTTSIIEQLKTIIDNEHKIKISHNPKQTTNFSEERNKMHEWSSSDYVLHIDTDERFDIDFLKNMRNIIEEYLDKNTIPLMFRFPRRNVELDIKKDPDYQVRFLNRQYTKWVRNVHEIPTIIKEDKYSLHSHDMIPANLVYLDKFIIEHLPKDRTDIRKRWDVLSDDISHNNKISNVETPTNEKITKLHDTINKKLLICSMFKDSSLWMNDILLSIDNFIDYNNNVSNDNRLLIKLAFLKSSSNDNTIETLDKYMESELKLPQSKMWYEKYDINNNTLSRYQKLAILRNYLIEKSLEKIKLDDDDLILFMDSDIKFDNSIIHELIIDMNKVNADIIAPLVCIEDNGVFKNNYFYDTLAFRNTDNEQFSHYRPYIFGNIKKSKIKKEKHEKIQIALEKIDNLNMLRKINWEFNLNTPLNDTFPDNLYREAYSLIDLNIPIEVNSVGSFYLMKYKVAKEIKYSGNNDSEQVEFMNNVRSKGYKIFVSQRLKVLHVNLEKYGLKWH